jgi:hypothetical protein
MRCLIFGAISRLVGKQAAACFHSEVFLRRRLASDRHTLQRRSSIISRLSSSWDLH